MLPTFVIGLREGVEGSLIVGIIAAFLAQRGARRALRQVWIGTGAAVALCLGVGITLDAIDRNLPQRAQERFETVVSLVAVAMVTSMIVWMRKHARSLKAELEGRAGGALAAGSTVALVLMAFLAVLREGLETAVFLVASFQSSTSRAASSSGAVLGLAVAVVIGVLIYRGGVRLDLAKFFRVTGFVLVLVAAGLVSFALHTAHEGGWLNSLQAQPIDLSSVVRPGSIPSALVTGVLGIQPKPTVAELLGWLAYCVPMSLFVLLPAAGARSRIAPRPAPVRASA